MSSAVVLFAILSLALLGGWLLTGEGRTAKRREREQERRKTRVLETARHLAQLRASHLGTRRLP